MHRALKQQTNQDEQLHRRAFLTDTTPVRWPRMDVVCIHRIQAIRKKRWPVDGFQESRIPICRAKTRVESQGSNSSIRQKKNKPEV